MISLDALAALAHAHSEDMGLPVAPIVIGERAHDSDVEPVFMGIVNMSRDSSYRESIAHSVDDAVRKARIQWAQGAAVVDLGAESSWAGTRRVGAQEQIELLLPVVEALSAEGIATSVEGYLPEVVDACLAAGTQVVNLTGRADDDTMFSLSAEHAATLVLCQIAGDTVRDGADLTRDRDPLPEMIEHFESRVARARELGVEHIVLDPGMGFHYGNLVEPMDRTRHQIAVFLNSFRLRRLGLPICHAMPQAIQIFGEELRTAEAFFAVMARLGGTGLFRTHEVPRVRAALTALNTLDTAAW